LLFLATRSGFTLVFFFLFVGEKLIEQADKERQQIERYEGNPHPRRCHRQTECHVIHIIIPVPLFLADYIILPRRVTETLGEALFLY
jgi:hypothetical protein